MKKTKIVCLGAGKLATQLITAFYRNNFEICQVYSRTQASAKELAEKYGASYTTELNKILTDADLYIYAVKDSALIDIIKSIKSNKGMHVHTAGSIPTSIFSVYQERFGVLYPFQTFSKQREVEFSQIPILVEANTEENVLYLEETAKKLSQVTLRCSFEQRKAVHLSGVFACNFTNHMYAIAANILINANMPFELLLPLINETAAKVHELSPLEAQTGPAIRYDNNIIDKHLEELNKLQYVKEIYEKMSKNIHRYGGLDD